MSHLIQIHPDDPQSRLIREAVEVLRRGGIIIYPTDSCYALGCHIGDKKAVEAIRRIRHLDDKHNLTLMCQSMAETSVYGVVDNIAFRLMKSLTPGAYTFILSATREVPRRLLHAKRKTIGIRIPSNNIAMALLKELGEPILSTTLILPGEEYPMTDPYDIRDTLGHQVDLIIDGGFCGMEPTTVIEFLDDIPHVVRQGKGDTDAIQA